MNYSEQEVENKFPKMVNIEFNGENCSIEYSVDEDSHTKVIIVPIKDQRLQPSLGEELRGVLNLNNNVLEVNPLLPDEKASNLKMEIIKRILRQEKIDFID